MGFLKKTWKNFGLPSTIRIIKKTWKQTGSFFKGLFGLDNNNNPLPPPPEIPEVVTPEVGLEKESITDMMLQSNAIIEDKRRRLLLFKSAFNAKGATLLQSKYDSKGSIF